MPQIITNGVNSQCRIAALDRVVWWQDHKGLVCEFLGACDECLLVSPFLASDFGALFANIDMIETRVELISTCAPRGDDQLVKPYALRDFGTAVKAKTGIWPTIGLDQDLHSKVYVFRRSGIPFAGIVTSANLTQSGLSRNHETGVLLQSEDLLLNLEKTCRNGLDYVSLADWQIEKLCQAADITRRNSDVNKDRDIGLKSLLNRYATPSAENRSTTLNPSAKYFIKVSGVSDRPILPVQRRPFADPHSQLTFSKEPKGMTLGDCLLEVAVGGACFLSYYACASAVWEFTKEEQAADADHKRWPYYVYANNLSLNYGATWYEDPLYYDPIISTFKRDQPSTPVTAAGKDHFKGAMQRGHSYIEVTKEFGEYVRRLIDHYRANKSMQATGENTGA